MGEKKMQITKTFSKEEQEKISIRLGLLYIKSVEKELYSLFSEVAGLTYEDEIPKRFHTELRFVINQLHAARKQYMQQGVIDDSAIQAIKEGYRIILKEKRRTNGVLSYN
jgi:hypothetical protein